jgi:predicted extracellular nuclease
MDNLFRGGDLVTNVTGILDYAFSLYRIQPTQGADYTAVNKRPETYNLAESDLNIASFNVLNYFTTLDDGINDICGPSGDMECRGADTVEELSRQRDKILAAMSQIDADIFGLMEIENDRLGAPTPDYAVADLVAGLNAIAGAGTYDYIATGPIGTDAIKQALIYKPANVTPVGDYQTLTSAYDSNFVDDKNRPTLAQVFEDNLTGETFVVAVNHLKSKGSDCVDLGDPDLGDGAGNCNLTRTAAAEVLVDWLVDETIFPEVENVLIIGDLNSYDKEDPIDAIKEGADDDLGTADDYVDMIHKELGEFAYGYVFDGHIGYLDYAMANKSLEIYIKDVTIWHINADEPDLIDYDMSFKQPAQDALYNDDPYRSSDHDPVIVTLSFPVAPVAVADEYKVLIDTTLVVSAGEGVLANDYDGNEDELTAVLETSVDPLRGTLSLNSDGSFSFNPVSGFLGEATFTYRASDGEFSSDPVTVTIIVYETLEIYLPLILR